MQFYHSAALHQATTEIQRVNLQFMGTITYLMQGTICTEYFVQSFLYYFRLNHLNQKYTILCNSMEQIELCIQRNSIFIIFNPCPRSMRKTK